MNADWRRQKEEEGKEEGSGEMNNGGLRVKENYGWRKAEWQIGGNESQMAKGKSRRVKDRDG